MFRSEKEHDIPEGQQPVDMLTAFYNLRAGIYGPLVRGAHLLIPTYSDDGFSEIEIDVLTLEQQGFPIYQRGCFLNSSFPGQGPECTLAREPPSLKQSKIPPSLPFKKGGT